jgi:hypothetical protein
MYRVFVIVLICSLILIVSAGCSQAPVEPAAQPESDMAGMEHSLAKEAEAEAGPEHGAAAHQAAQSGQLGMAMNALKNGADFHLEIVSEIPGQYRLYLSDNNRKPLSPEGYKGAVAVIRPDGSEIASIPLVVRADHLQAEGGPTDPVSQLDVRVTIEGPDLVEVQEMDFTLSTFAVT